MIATKTVSMKPGSVPCKWYVIDAKGQILGRLVSKIAHILMGKHKPEFTPHVDHGDYVVVINAEKVRVTGDKLKDKLYYRHTGRPGGLKTTRLEQMVATHPTRVIELAVKGMLSKNSLGRTRFKKLFVYKGDAHPHTAQQPEEFVVETGK